eukprot:gene26638-35312_t
MYRKDQRVSVCWKESGCTFSACITAINGDGSYDAAYDELVQGKQCTERSVSADRLTTNLVIVNPTKGNSVEDLDEENLSLTNFDFIFIHDSLTLQKIQELVEKDVNRLGLLCRLCSQRHSILEDEPLPLSLMDELSPSIPTDELKASDDSHLTKLHTYIACASVVFKILAVENWRCSQFSVGRMAADSGPETAMKESIGIIVSDEMIEKSIRSMNSFVAINILATKVEIKAAAATSATDAAPVTPESASSAVRKREVSATVSRSRGKSVGKSRESKTESSHKRVLTELISDLIPTIVQFVKSLEYLLTSSKQSERVFISISEFFFSVLKCDPGICPIGDLIDSNSSDRYIFRLEKSCIPIYRILYSQYPSFHQYLLIEHIGTFLQTHSIKKKSKEEEPELSKAMLINCYKSCSIFVCELFKRCSHKDASAEYRTTTSNLVDELVVAIHTPLWPISLLLVT